MPRVIKRYPNRKLYDADARAYVSLEEIAAIVRGGETVQVLDHATGDDITAQTLTQVILDEGKRGPSLLPTDLLHGLLRRGEQLVTGSIDRVTRVLPVARHDELAQLRGQLASLEQTLGTLLRDDSAAVKKPARKKKSAPRAK